MNFNEMIKDDLNIFYDTEEFAVLSKYKNKDIPIIIRGDIEMEIESIKQHVITSLTKNVKDVKVGDKFSFNDKEYKCINFEHQINLNETIIVLSEND